jgi:hypothetical protein
MTKIAASYSKSTGPDGVRLKVTPASSPQAGFSFARLILSGMIAYFGLAIIGAVLGRVLMGFFGMFGSFGFKIAGFLAVAVGCVLGPFLWYKSYKWLTGWYFRTQAKTRHAYDVELLVNSSGIKNLATNHFINRDDIHRLVLKNGFDGSVDIPMTNMVVAGNALTVGTMAAGHAITNGFAAVANAQKRAAAAVSYQVAVEAGGVSHLLAGGMNDVCAHGLMTEIDRALNS